MQPKRALDKLGYETFICMQWYIYAGGPESLNSQITFNLRQRNGLDNVYEFYVHYKFTGN